MDQNLSDKISVLQKNFYELNNLFELSIIANQAYCLDDLLTGFANFLVMNLNIEDVEFFIPQDAVYSSVVNKDHHSYQFECHQEGIWTLMQEEDILKIKNPDGEIAYKAFWKQYHLNENVEFLKAFKKDSKLPFCICTISGKKDGTPYNSADFEFLKKTFNYIEPTLLKLIKYKEEHDEMRELYKTLHNISILYSISQAVNFIDDLKRLLNVILSKAIDTLQAEKGSLMLYEYADNSLRVKVVNGLYDKQQENDINNGLIECSSIKIGEGIAGSVFADKKPIITNLGQNDPRFIQKNKLNNVSSLLCVPLVVKGEAIGVINITNKKHDKLFNKQDLEFMEALANQAAIAIDNAKLYELATKDGLTKLYIYRHFYLLLENEIKRCARYNHVMTLVIMDIDDFKKVNDTYGHLVGDQTLRELANVITSTIRKIDVAARYGGEEFALILPETSINDAKVIVKRLKENISKIRIETKDGVVTPTVSIGMADFPACANDEKTLIELADIALYTAKNTGKNCIYEYNKEEGCLLVE